MKRIPLLLAAIVLITKTTAADLPLPAVISDHAMLQAGKPVAM